MNNLIDAVVTSGGQAVVLGNGLEPLLVRVVNGSYECRLMKIDFSVSPLEVKE